jgi:hypothetical protein
MPSVTREALLKSARERYKNGFPRETAEKISKANSGKPKPWLLGKNHHLWKGDNVSYRALHHWVTRHLGSPKHCTYCGRDDQKKYEWANISHAYKRELSDWIRLCTKCHAKMDGNRGRKKLNTV